MPNTEPARTQQNSRPRKILGLRPWLFWGAATLVLLASASYLGHMPVRRLVAVIGGVRQSAVRAQLKKRLDQTPGGANRLAMSLTSHGNQCARRRQYAKAFQLYRQSLEIARRFNLRDRAEACLEMMGNAFYHVGQADSAAIYYQKAQELARVNCVPSQVSGSFLNRGVSLIRDPETNDSACVILRRALDMALDVGDSNGIELATYNLGICYLWGTVPDSCISLLRRDLALIAGRRNDQGKAVALYNMGIAFCLKHEWDSAYRVLQQALSYYAARKDQRNTWEVQEYLDSVRNRGSIAETPADRAVPRVRPPRNLKHGETALDFYHYLEYLRWVREAMRDTGGD